MADVSILEPDVVRLGYAAVKGTRHDERAEVVLDDHGPVGDRAFCLVDVEQRRVLRTVTHRALVGVRAHWDGSALNVVLPDGRAAGGPPRPSGEDVVCDYWGRQVPHTLTEGPHSALLSDHLGRDVRLATAPRGGVVYGAPVSLITTASLRDLEARSGRSDVVTTAARFRMTAVVDAGDTPYVEEGWFGRELRLGDAVVRVHGPVPRCGVVDLDPETGEKDGSLLKTLAGYRPRTGGEPWFGVDATVVSPGVVRR